MAVDGDPATYSFAAFGGGSSDIGWWQVDLGEIYKITRMTVVNSQDSTGKHLNELHIRDLHGPGGPRAGPGYKK